MKRPILTALLTILILSPGVWAQKRKDLQNSTPPPAIRIEHPVNKEGTPTEHASGSSKKSKLEHGTRAAHPSKSKPGVESDHHKTGPVIQRKGSKQGHYRKPAKKD